MDDRYCLRKDNDGRWYIIEWGKRALFNSLLSIDQEFFIDEFEGDKILGDIENISFSMPQINADEEEYYE